MPQQRSCYIYCFGTTLAASYFTRNPKVAYASLVFSGLAYQESLKSGIANGLSTEDAIKNAKIDGLSEGLTELGPTKFLSDALTIGMKWEAKQSVSFN